ncbi:COG3014 family protein [Kaarinaea lacus]
MILFRGVCCVLLGASVYGCAGYSANIHSVEQHLVTQNYQTALATLDKLYADSDRDAVLYNLNKGMLLRMNHEYSASNDAFETAKQLVERLEAISVTEQTSSLLVNDQVKSYEGEIFEKLLLHFYKILNYLELGKKDEARVEVLQADQRLKEIKQKLSRDDLPEEAWIRYMSGIVFEDLGEWSDAMIAYRKAYQAYKNYLASYKLSIPFSLKLALLRLADRQGLYDELEQYKQEFGINQWETIAERQNKGELVIVVNSGLAPVKKPNSATVISPTSGQLIRISVPVYVKRPIAVSGVNYNVADEQGQLEITEIVDPLAIKALEQNMPTIIARAAARQALKYQATKQANQENSAFGLLVNIGGALLEQADTRSWTTLPQGIYMARIALKPGTYNLSLNIVSSYDGKDRVVNFDGLKIKAGQNTYQSLHWIPANVTNIPGSPREYTRVNTTYEIR